MKCSYLSSILMSIILILISVVCLGQNQIQIDSVIGSFSSAIAIEYASYGVLINSARVNGIQIEEAGDNGIVMGNVGGDGVFVLNAGGDGIDIGTVSGEGVFIRDAALDGIEILNAGGDGVDIGTVGGDGVLIRDAGFDGIKIENAGNDGIEIGTAVRDGIRILDAGSDGITILNAGSYGIDIGAIGSFGVLIRDAGSDGIRILDAVDDGIGIGSVGGDGVFVFEADDWSANIQGNKNLTATPAGHISHFYNRASGGSADVLALKVGQTGTVTSASNFITFFKGNDVALGSIEGNGTGGVTFKSGGADFAELLPSHEHSTDINPGDIVGIHAGIISLKTSQSDQAMVITDQPIIIGNQQAEDGAHEIVSFIGQVPVNVRGPVQDGDWIVASGMNDGTGLAIPSTDITLDHLIVGRAWESSNEPGLKRINTVVGLDHSRAKDGIIQHLKLENQEQNLEIKSLQLQIDELKRLIMKKG